MTTGRTAELRVLERENFQQLLDVARGAMAIGLWARRFARGPSSTMTCAR